MKIEPRIVAEIAIDSVRRDVKFKTVHSWTENAVGRLAACASITDDWIISGWRNEAFFLTGDYASRHKLRW